MSKQSKVEYKKVKAFNMEGREIGQFEELYFVPVEELDIIEAFKIYNRKKTFPIINVKIDGLSPISYILKVIKEICCYNLSLGYCRKLNVEIRIRKKDDLHFLSEFIDDMSSCCKIAVVIDYEDVFCRDQISLKNIDFIRVNFHGKYIDVPITLPFVDTSECYLLSRVTVSNLLNFYELINVLKESGFDGVQIVKEHTESEEKLDDIQRVILRSLAEKEDEIKIFLESNLEYVSQPMFKIRDFDHGLCFASHLFTTIKAGEIIACPFSNYQSYDDISEIKNRKVVCSNSVGCDDCGYISDNILYRKVYDELNK